MPPRRSPSCSALPARKIGEVPRKSDYWDVTDEQVVAKTGKPLAQWRAVLDALGAAGRKANDVVAALQRTTACPGTGRERSRLGASSSKTPPEPAAAPKAGLQPLSRGAAAFLAGPIRLVPTASSSIHNVCACGSRPGPKYGVNRNWLNFIRGKSAERSTTSVRSI